MELSIIVPCYNESEGLGHLVEKLGEFERAYPGIYELVLVDDGSKDNTCELLKKTFSDAGKHSIKIIKHEVNRGIGAAVRTGIANTTGEYIATIDSDCTYAPLYLAEMLDIIKKEKGDIITASPYHPQGKVEGVPGHRLILSKGLSVIYDMILGARIYTFTSIFRIYRADAIKKVRFDSDRFLSQAEMLIRSLKRGYKVIEYPTILTKRAYGTSNAKVVGVIKEHLGFISKLLFSKEEI